MVLMELNSKLWKKVYQYKVCPPRHTFRVA